MCGLTMGRIASFYYMKHQTMATFAQRLGPGMAVQVSPAAMMGCACTAPASRQRSTATFPCHAMLCCAGVSRRAVAAPVGLQSQGMAAPGWRLRHAHVAHPPTHRVPNLGLLLLPPQDLLPVLCAAAEYDELPVRHNEDKLNVVLAQQVRWAVDTRTAGEPGGASAVRAALPLPACDHPICEASSAGWDGAWIRRWLTSCSARPAACR